MALRKNNLLLLIVTTLTFIGCGTSMKEKELYEIKAPDKSFKLVVTQTWQGIPYGVKGNIYISDWDKNSQRYIDKYFEDFDNDLVVEERIVWDEQLKGFRWKKHLVNLTTFPLNDVSAQK
jgi:hypothetical protein